METVQEKQTRRQKLIGVVSSAAGDKTIRVVVESVVKHPRYGKYIKKQTKLAAHDEANTASVGDTVEITTCRRISRTKAYRLLRIIKKSSAALADADRG